MADKDCTGRMAGNDGTDNMAGQDGTGRMADKDRMSIYINSIHDLGVQVIAAL